MVAVLLTEIWDILAYFWYSSEKGAYLQTFVVRDGLFKPREITYTYDIINGSSAVHKVKPFGNITYNNLVKIQFNYQFSARCG